MPDITESARYLLEHAHYTEDLALWTAIGAQASGPVLDLGCAAGRLAIALADVGCEVVALDADPRMLDALAANAAAAGVAPRIHPVCADMRTFVLDTPVALAIASMNTLQVLLRPEDQLACLGQVHTALVPDGEFWFDLAVPDIGDVMNSLGTVRAGDVYADPATGVRLAHSFWYDWVDPISQNAQFTHRVDEIAADGASSSYFREHQVHLFAPVELGHLLARAGFGVVQSWGDFAGAPLEAGADRQVYRCRVQA